VTYDPDPLPAGNRLLRVLLASFRLGAAFGVEVRMYALAAVLVPVLTAIEFAGARCGLLEILVHSAVTTLLLYTLVWSHEMCHVAAGRRYGIPADLITLSPLGGLAHLSARSPGPRPDAVIALAGPAVHLAWLALVWPLSRVVLPWDGAPDGWLFSPHGWAVSFLFQANLGLLLFNLLPFLPLDGGRVLRSVLAARLPVERAALVAARAGEVGGVLIALYALWQGGIYGGLTLAVGISVFLGARRERTLLRWGVPPYASEAWGGGDPYSDDQSWRGGGARGREARSRPGLLRRWLLARRARAGLRRATEAAAFDAEVDRILDRVKDVGLAGLTRSERVTLERASRAKRRERDSSR
jgi:Zn-dependent protease